MTFIQETDNDNDKQMTAYPIKLPDVHATGALAIRRHAGVLVLARRRGREV
jgi:hypothetical protein